MKIILTGSLGNISKPLTQMLVGRGHQVTVISSSPERKRDIEAVGANAAIGSIRALDFLVKTFQDADVVYLMEPPAVHAMLDKNFDIYEDTRQIVNNYAKAIEQSNVKKVVHLSSIGAHTDEGVGILKFHFIAESILKALPADIAIKFMRPVGFYGNLLSHIEVIKSLSKGFIGSLMALQYYGISGLLSGKRGVILANYGGDVINLMASPNDIAAVIAEEMEQPFNGHAIRYIASEEITCNQTAQILGEAIGKPYLKWGRISDKMLANAMRKRGMSEMFVNGFVEMGAAGRSGKLYEDYYKHRPVLQKTKLKEFAVEFARVFNQS